jgi:hypothetical protein
MTDTEGTPPEREALIDAAMSQILEEKGAALISGEMDAAAQWLELAAKLTSTPEEDWPIELGAELTVYSTFIFAHAMSSVGIPFDVAVDAFLSESWDVHFVGNDEAGKWTFTQPDTGDVVEVPHG